MITIGIHGPAQGKRMTDDDLIEWMNMALSYTEWLTIYPDPDEDDEEMGWQRIQAHAFLTLWRFVHSKGLIVSEYTH